jgi:hypothetical protein
MAYLGIILAVYALLITPMHLRLDMAVGKHLSGAMVLHIWGLRLQANLGLIRDDQGQLHLALRMKGSPKQHSDSVVDAWKRAIKIVRFIRETEWTQTFLSRTVSVLHVGLIARLGFSDAAQTALISGAASIFLDIWRQKLKIRGIPCNVRAWPDFAGNPCAAQLSCILFMRLGNLLLGCALAGFAVWVAHRREKKWNREEERAWSTQSET